MGKMSMNIIFLDFDGVLATASYDMYLVNNNYSECDEDGRLALLQSAKRIFFQKKIATDDRERLQMPLSYHKSKNKNSGGYEDEYVRSRERMVAPHDRRTTDNRTQKRFCSQRTSA